MNMDIQDMVWGGGHGLGVLGQDMDMWRALVNTVMDLQVP
jgi:hypothetical protein